MDLHSKLNQELLESFGKLEQLCNQIYGENHGVTSYIEDMDNMLASAKYRVDNWDYYYKNLKLVRHKRNNLSHGEVLFSERYAESEDIQFISDFYKLILNSNDPISLYKKHTKASAPISRNHSDTSAYKNHQNKGCSSELKAFFVSMAAASIILALLVLFFKAYFK